MPASHDIKTAKKTIDFNDLLLSSIDQALNSLGESIKQSIYFHIENKFKITRTEIPSNLNDFQQALEKIFGVGARFIEILIMKNLYEKIGLQIAIDNGQELEFIKYVNTAKQCYLK
jgi:hypothetical protein